MTGGGTICLTFTMAAVGVPTMSKQTFITTERVWYSDGMVWSAEMEKQLILSLSMRKARAEEKQIP